MKHLKIILTAIIILQNLGGAIAQSNERIKVIFGTRSRSNHNGGCEGEKGICLIITLQRSNQLDNTGIAEINLNEDGKIVFNILEDSSPAQDDENTFYIFERKEIPQEICKELGYDRIVLQPGKYFLNKSENPLGTAVIDAEIN